MTAAVGPEIENARRAGRERARGGRSRGTAAEQIFRTTQGTCKKKYSEIKPLVLYLSFQKGQGDLSAKQRRPSVFKGESRIEKDLWKLCQLLAWQNLVECFPEVSFAEVYPHAKQVCTHG